MYLFREYTCALWGKKNEIAVHCEIVKMKEMRFSRDIKWPENNLCKNVQYISHKFKKNHWLLVAEI